MQESFLYQIMFGEICLKLRFGKQIKNFLIEHLKRDMMYFLQLHLIRREKVAILKKNCLI